MSNKRSAFVARLHDEDADEEANAFRRNGKNKGVDLKGYEEEMKVFNIDNSEDEGEGAAVKKREQKGNEKGTGEARNVSRKLKGDGNAAKVNRLVSSCFLDYLFRNSLPEA